MSFTSDTVIEQSPGSWRQVEAYEKGDPISAASSLGTAWSWAESTVVYNVGGETRPQPAIYIRFGGGGELVVSLDQPMMTRGGAMKPANALDPETDTLVGSDGSAVPVTTVMTGMFNGRFYDLVATTEQWEGTGDGHLLNCAGVICGDYLVQMHQGEERNASER